jgi:integrase
MEIWQGVNPKFVQELLGHADISLALNVYSHVLPDMGDAAAGAMDTGKAAAALRASCTA